MRQLIPQGPDVDLDDRDALLELYRPPRADWLRLNLVATVDGSAAGTDGTSETLTSRADRRILGVIRELADVVLVGAGSVRAEGYLMPKRAPLAIMTRTGDLRGHRLDDVSRVTVFGPQGAREGVAATLGARFVVAADVVGALRDEGWQSIVCEGGPTLATELVPVADEVCLTTAALIGGPTLPLLAGAVPSTRLTLAGLLADESMLFARWRISPSGSPASA